MESRPDYLYATPPLNKNISELPLIYSHTLAAAVRSSSPISRSPLAGIIQWCILTPLASQTDSQDSTQTRTISEHESNNGKYSELKTKTNIVLPLSTLKKDGTEDASSLVAALHASVLSVVLSRSSNTQSNYPALSRDDVAVIVAALLGFKQELWSTKMKSDHFVKSRMDECVERLAQFMQIGLSNGTVDLSAGMLV